jgi:phosphatidylglycerophosphatase A
MSRAREFLYLAIGTSFGLGLSPVAPGSFGALIGVAYHVGVVVYGPAPWHVPALVAGLAAVVAANHWLTPWAVARWNDEDPRHFVLDEVAGYLVVPILFRGGELWQVALYGFLLFRVFDIIKIPPARQIDQNLHGPWGIVLDDLISGVYAALALYALVWLGVLPP